MRVSTHSLVCSFPDRKFGQLRISRVVITTRHFPFLKIEVPAHAAAQAHAEGAAITREGPAHLSVPATKEPKDPAVIDVTFFVGLVIKDANQPSPQKLWPALKPAQPVH